MEFTRHRISFMAPLAAIAGIAWLATGYRQGSAHAAGGAVSDPSKDPVVEEYVPSDFEKRGAVYEDISSTRARTIDGLLYSLKKLPANASVEEYDSGQRACAVRLLGILRASDATAPLLDMIDANFASSGTGFGRNYEGIVVAALINIGNPASHMAVEYLAKDKSEKRAPMYVRVIAQVEGVDVGKFMVQQAADKEKDPAKKARLEAAIRLFDKADQPIP